MGPFHRTTYRPRWRQRDPVIWRRLASDLWTLAAVLALIVTAAMLAEWFVHS